MSVKQVVMDRAAKHFSATSNVSGKQNTASINIPVKYPAKNARGRNE